MHSLSGKATKPLSWSVLEIEKVLGCRHTAVSMSVMPHGHGRPLSFPLSPRKVVHIAENGVPCSCFTLPVKHRWDFDCFDVQHFPTTVELAFGPHPLIISYIHCCGNILMDEKIIGVIVTIIRRIRDER